MGQATSNPVSRTGKFLPTYSVCKNHGYIAGEEYVCPECGEKTEVYSRITGYYRPVQNWNDGKSQEYKDRAVYNIETSVCKRNGKSNSSLEECTACGGNDGIYLFKTETCPNCKIAIALLDKAGVKYETVLANAENKSLVDAYGIKQAPTLVVVKDGNVEKFAGVSDIKKFLA